MPINPIGTKTMETDRLILRRFVIEDAQDMFANWANDADVCKFLSWNPHGTLAVTQALLEHWIAAYENENTYNWAIELKELGSVIGSISAMNVSEKDCSCEIGYCISKQFWSKGIATEALKSLIYFFFTQVGLNRIQASHDPLNIASGKVMEHAGMTLEGTLRQRRMCRDGTFADSNIWAILRRDYKGAVQ